MKGVKGYGFFIVLLVVIGIAYLCNNYIMDYDRDSYSVSQFKQDLQDKKIKKVTIEQNAEVPTGQLVIQYEKGTKQLYVSDVNEMVSYLDDQNFTEYHLSDVARTPWYLEILPYIIGFVLFFVLFSMMMPNAGGSGNKMANFGKSRQLLRCRMTK